MDKRNSYIPGDHTEWTAEINCVKVLNKDTDKMITIPYPGAALWDLLQQKYPIDRIISIMSAVTGKNRTYVKNLVENNIHKWLEDGLIQ